MDTGRFQRTIARPSAVEGFGYWSGCDVRVEFRPAPPDTGIVFVRRDLKPAVRIPARLEHRIAVPRRTTLRTDGAQVEMVEHVLAALAGLEIDNCEVWVDAAEMPGCDGSSLPFVEAIDSSGVEVQPGRRAQITVRSIVRIEDGPAWVEARPTATGAMSVEFCIDYDSLASIGRQRVAVRITPEAFRRELAASRTFMTRREADELLAQGLGQRVTATDLLIFNEAGPIDNQVRFRDECVRHKALDVVGDLSLLGCDIRGHIVGFRSGHRHNAALAAAIVERFGPQATQSLRRWA